MHKISKIIKPGIIFGKDIKTIFTIAKKNKFAIPAVNCIGTDSINAVLSAAYEAQSPVIIQLSYSGASFIAGAKINTVKYQCPYKQSIIGAISIAHYIHKLSKYYQIPVILHTDHCYQEILPWINALIEEGEKNFQKTGIPLFSSHMIDLSKEKIEKNISTCKKYLQRMSKINMILEIELGCTGGEEDGIDNSSLKKESLYTSPEEVNYAYEQLNTISDQFTIAASFGNVHGVYSPGSIQLKPKILKKSQSYIRNKHKLLNINPINFVFHGSSGTNIHDIKKAISYGVVKINIDTDIQWATWEGILKYYYINKHGLHSQLGNDKGIEYPNKKYYDPRVWIHESQKNIKKRLIQSFQDFNSCNQL
ncbi:class II fructose-bisphosphate aldolase [Buchnera aphidicola (Thelaxes californica)]|uniref:Fructose-bisphosphate aldolase n=1 Tax=Buchnera aphidicola (Thelaxes californica) TaxID=1315998 RepID=A0A4D6YLI1_9GAMM|nr:class II fructose-bisphosphate aldolase [Buchnera aphidicola]QCI26870.1 class II fructose-bisphosphate aldolase [Buchnera aphidicola (Thelaxes californica)]